MVVTIFIIYLLGVCGLLFAYGAGRLEWLDDLVPLVIVTWPAWVVIALINLPFIGIYKLGRRFR